MSIPPLTPDSHARWRFIRDVLYFQLKLVLGNLQNFLLVPVSLGAALVDLLHKSGREGARFYRVLDWGRRTDEAIDVYSAIGGYHSTADDDGAAMKSRYTVDSVLAKIEGVIVREYEKGGTAATIKSAVDKTIDEMHAKTAPAGDAIKTVAEKLRDKIEKPPG